MISVACWNPADQRIMKLGVSGDLFGGESRMVGERIKTTREMPPKSRVGVKSTFLNHGTAAD